MDCPVTSHEDSHSSKEFFFPSLRSPIILLEATRQRQTSPVTVRSYQNGSAFNLSLGSYASKLSSTGEREREREEKFAKSSMERIEAKSKAE